jgi:hypothetical protein
MRENLLSLRDRRPVAFDSSREFRKAHFFGRRMGCTYRAVLFLQGFSRFA